MTFLVQQTLIYAIPLMIVALAGVFAERSGIINLALEGIMIFGAFVGVYFFSFLKISPPGIKISRIAATIKLYRITRNTPLRVVLREFS